MIRAKTGIYLKIILWSERSQTKQILCNFIDENSRKRNLNYTNRKPDQWLLWDKGGIAGTKEEQEEKITQGYEKKLSGGDRYVHYFDCSDGFMSLHIYENP